MSSRTIKIMGRVSMSLAMLSALLFAIPAMAQVSDTVKVASDFADLARQKDIVWLALIVAMVSMTISALKDYWIGRSISQLREHLITRPCILVKKDGDK
jgi:TRAP-type C4-dicarboxylate transport system permease small subunit